MIDTYKIGDSVHHCPICNHPHPETIIIQKNIQEAVCEGCKYLDGEKTDGLNGTDNVAVLFPDKPSAAPIPPQPEIVKVLEDYLLDAASGKMTGMLIIGISDTGSVRTAIAGKIPLSHALSSLEQMKFGMLARDYAKQISAE